jgi:outer membrane protein TolC
MPSHLLLLGAAAHALTLEEAWSAAAASGVETRLVRESVVQAETLRGKAGALVSPKLVLQGHYTINEKEIAWDPMESFSIPEEYAELLDLPDSEPIVFQKREYADGNVSVIQPLFSGVALPALGAAKNMVRAARDDARAQLGKLKAGVARAYYGLLVAREFEAISGAALASAEQHAALAEAQVAAGVAPPTARLQGQIARSRAERQRAQAREGVVAAGESFARLTGLDAAATLQLPAPVPLPAASLEEIEVRALGGRADLAAAGARVKASRFARLAQDLDWLPTVDGRFTFNYTENTGGFVDDPDTWMVVFTASWTAWDGGYRMAESRRLASQAAQAALAERAARESVAVEVRSLWATLDRAERSLALVQQEVRLAEQNQALAEAAFTAGTITFLDLEDARVALQAARGAHLQERSTRDLARVDLAVATGDL